MKKTHTIDFESLMRDEEFIRLVRESPSLAEWVQLLIVRAR